LPVAFGGRFDFVAMSDKGIEEDKGE